VTRREWFGDPPGSWQSAPLGRFFDVALGKMLNSSKGAEGETQAPYLAAGSIQPEHLVLDETKTMPFTEAELSQYDLRKGDVVVVEGGAGYGRSHLIAQDMPGWGFQNHVARLRGRGPVVAGFLLYCMKACLVSGYIEANNRTATLPSLSRDVLRSLPIPIPPLDEQRDIARYLDRETARIDTLIVEQQLLIEMLQERRQALIEHGVFGLDDPARAEDRKRPTIGKHQAVEPLLARCPAGWEIRRFKAALDRRDDRNEDLSLPMMSLKSSGHVVPRDGGRQEPDEVNLPRYLVIRPGDLVVNPMWLIGAAIGVTEVEGAVSPDYRVFRSNGSHYPRYLHHLLRSRSYVDQYLLYTRALTTFDRRVQQPDLDNLPLPVPPLDEQRRIADHLDEQTAKIDTLIAATRTLIELARERRSALITAAVTGQIDVREAA
jgi:type I restriction enzyme S subunit